MYQAYPKVVLHDHLDGGLRVATVLELADECGYTGLPAQEETELAEWFDQGTSGSLERYLEAFTHTVAVMQTESAIDRVAYESACDLAADGAVYAEIRFAPSLLTERGLHRVAVLEAAVNGFRRAERGTGIRVGLIADALRQWDDSAESAAAAIALRGQGVVGFDLAGPEAGFPADDHLPACRAVREAGMGLTVHAGEAFGPPSIWTALQRCGAHRVGHGVQVIDDCRVEDGTIVEYGRIAGYVRDFQVHLEVCPTSNLHTKGWTAEEHPVGVLYRHGFNVGISPDNRLMSRVSMSDEFELLATHHGFDSADFHAVTRNAMAAAFCDLDTKQRLLAEIDEAYASIPT